MDRQLIAAAKRHKLPVQLSAFTKADIAALRQLATEHDVPVIIAGTLDLAGSGVDLLHVHGTGSLDELHETARAFGKTGLPFSVSVGEGIPLASAIERLDADAAARPWHYLLGSIEPDAAVAALEALFRGAPALAHRVVGINADARDLSAADFAPRMHEIARDFGLHVLGGAEGMDEEKFEALAAYRV